MIIVDRTGTIQAWNEAAERLLGTRASGAEGKTLALIVPPEHRARHMAGFHTAVEGGILAHSGAVARVKALTADGDLQALGMSLALLYAADGIADGWWRSCAPSNRRTPNSSRIEATASNAFSIAPYAPRLVSRGWPTKHRNCRRVRPR
jgi:PAS domain S-box-containing protein